MKRLLMILMFAASFCVLAGEPTTQKKEEGHTKMTRSITSEGPMAGLSTSRPSKTPVSTRQQDAEPPPRTQDHARTSRNRTKRGPKPPSWSEQEARATRKATQTALKRRMNCPAALALIKNRPQDAYTNEAPHRYGDCNEAELPRTPDEGPPAAQPNHKPQQKPPTSPTTPRQTAALVCHWACHGAHLPWAGGAAPRTPRSLELRRRGDCPRRTPFARHPAG